MPGHYGKFTKIWELHSFLLIQISYSWKRRRWQHGICNPQPFEEFYVYTSKPERDFYFFKGIESRDSSSLKFVSFKSLYLDIWRLICELFINSIWFLMDLWSFYAKRLQNHSNFPFIYFFSKDNWGCFIESLIILICSTHIRKVPTAAPASFLFSYWLISILVEWTPIGWSLVWFIIGTFCYSIFICI